MHLVLLETSGNQNYIFATNKLRENVGASELTYRAGTQWVLEAVEVITGKKLWADDAEKLRKNLCESALNPPIDPNDKTAVEVMTATSGKALLLVNDRAVGQRIIRAVTNKALQEAPGLDVCGVISKGFDWDTERLGDVNREVHEKFETVRANRPGPAWRFFRLPVVDECQTSGMPASMLDDTRAGKPAPRSEMSNLKWCAKEQANDRLKTLLDRASNPAAFGADFAENVNWLEKNCEWLAVVHADGNGLGSIFLDFAEHAGCRDAVKNRAYIESFRKFSIALDICTEKAFLHATEQMVKRRGDTSFTFPILPIVLGGDDLTVVCDGKDALQFTHDFLSAFEDQTKASHEIVNDIIPRIAGKGLSACAGVAIIKPHFPFSAAYDLAEQLIVSAKRVKTLLQTPCSSLDFHALYDSSSSELQEIRRKLRVDDNQTKLYARPFVVTDANHFSADSDEHKWASQHHWSELVSRVDAIFAKDEDEKRKLPNSQLHDLRAALFLGQDSAQARYELIRERYVDKGIRKLETEAKKLFTEDSKPDDDLKQRSFTYLLDAMDAANFWRKDDAE